jgi:hypothetical protein
MNFSTYSKEQLIEYCKNLYNEHGMVSLTFESLSDISNLYFSLYKYGLTQKSIIDLLGLTEEYNQFKKDNSKWSFENIKIHAKKVIEEYGYLPPAEWLRKNGYGSLVTGLYDLNMTFGDLRK